MRFQYRFPRLYDFFIRLIYPPRLMHSFRNKVGVQKSVFEPAAGYGRMARYIDPSNSYSGIDLNPVFTRHARQKGLDVKEGDIFIPKNYPKADVIILVDVIHHLSQGKNKKLFDILFSNAKERIVIVEPAFVHFESRYGLFGKLLDKLLLWFDNDGFNNIDRWFTDEEYNKLFTTRFGSSIGKSFNFSCEKIANHYLVTFTRTKQLAQP